MYTHVMVDSNKDSTGSFLGFKKITVVFVLGGPGCGKGTQCTKIAENFGFTHLSVGELLREEVKSGSEDGAMIRNMMKEGKIVPPEVTIKLLLRAILESGNDKFLIDGFPRDEENRAAFESITNVEPDFVLFLDCPEEEMERRILARNQGRVDDSIQTMRKRFRVYMDSTVPVLDHYNSKAKLRKVDASRPIDKVFEDVKVIFAPFGAKANNSMRRSSIRMGMGHERVISLVERLCRATRDIIAYIFSKLRSFYPPACVTRKALKST
ncbi:UMP-CMP kinase 3-like isoform X1 [Zingiber officinale]|uniref:UMP-CMP kinase 3-like isoform X1 n=1 Tax=Zingiber officinale TaxID=94328 RepID=UPI001C4C1646|nr:UMP-CMP kinase 3-like isoform X1 [Zingiber officinale]XP_042435690.1 UMP-CMP kinase 3-like isoform X1 [Zingiber officinale]